jgi:hypothetical protein
MSSFLNMTTEKVILSQMELLFFESDRRQEFVKSMLRNMAGCKRWGFDLIE